MKTQKDDLDIKETSKDRVQNIDDDLYDMLDCYGYLESDLDYEMRENGVSWSDFI